MTTPEMPSDPEKAVVQLETGPMRYSDVGSGPVIVAVHGSPGSGRDFRWLAPVLEPHCRVIRIDQSGHGDTPPHGRSHWTVGGRARLLAAFLEAMDLIDVTLVGHSMGGPVCFEAALLAPARVSRIACISSLGMRKHQLLRGMPARTASIALLTPILGRMLMPGLRRGMKASGFSASTPDHEAADSLHAIARVDFSKRAASVVAYAATGLPTFVAWAENDPIIEPAIYKELAESLPPGPRLPFPNGGHNPQKAHAVEIGEALLAWPA